MWTGLSTIEDHVALSWPQTFPIVVKNTGMCQEKSLRVWLLDYSTVFDTVDHSILLRKLENMGGSRLSGPLVHCFSLWSSCSRAPRLVRHNRTQSGVPLMRMYPGGTLFGQFDLWSISATCSLRLTSLNI